MQRAFKGVWIPKEIWLSAELSLQEKVFLVEIDSLDNEKGCFATNAHFSEFFTLSKNRCSEIIGSLEKKGYISITKIPKKGTKEVTRILKIKSSDSRQTPSDSRQTPSDSRQTPSDSRQTPSENWEGNNTYINTINNPLSNTDKKDSKRCSQLPSNPKPEIEFKIDEIIKYLNLKTGKSFDAETEGNRKYIRARLKAKATLEQIKYVIDVMCAYWLDNEEMKSNLNPVTLFRPSNFDRYLNRDMPKQKERTLRDVALEGNIDLAGFLRGES